MLTWFYQTLLAGFVLVPVTIAFILTLDWYYDGSLALVGLIIMALVASFALITLTSIVGIPLRVVPALRGWWRERPWVALVLVAAGFLALVLARAFATLERWEVEDGFYTQTYSPQPVLATAGGLLLAFGLLHWWPRRERDVTPQAPE